MPDLTEPRPDIQSERTPAEKISPEFAGRLAALPAGECVRTVILPAQDEAGEPVRGAARAARLDAIKAATAAHFAAVDQVLASCGGRRVSEQGNSLGFVVVDATAAAVHALCDLPWVHAVLEDQPMRPVG